MHEDNLRVAKRVCLLRGRLCSRGAERPLHGGAADAAVVGASEGGGSPLRNEVAAKGTATAHQLNATLYLHHHYSVP